MALNATVNAKLESPQYLLENLVRTVQFLLDISVFRQSVFHVGNGLNLLHFHIKKILKHGAKTHHYSVYSQSSYAEFDTWLEKTLLSHNLLHELRKQSASFRAHYYYEWAFLRSEQLYQYFLDCLYSLATRDFNVLNNIPSYKFGYRLPITYEFPLNGPLLFSLTSNKPMPNRKPRLNTMSHSISTTTPSEVPTRSIGNRPTLESVAEHTKESDNSDIEDINEESPRHIPEFSYSYGSPVISVPNFSQLEDQPRLDPMFACFRGKEDFDLESQDESVIANESAGFQDKLTVSVSTPTPSLSPNSRHPLQSPVPSTPKSFLESGGFVQPLCTAPLGHFPLPYKGQSLTSFLTSLSDTSQPELDRENAHFNVSEALISAFETMKVKQKMEQLQEQRRKERIDAMFGEVRKPLTNPEHSGIVKKRLLLRSPGLRLRQPDRQDSHVGFTTEESENEFWKQSRHPPSQIKRKPKVLEKLGSDGRSEGLFSTSEVTSSGSQSLSSSSEDIGSASFSAESVALNLLRNANMEERHLPQASELQWIVTDVDTPQSLLPLPKNWNSATESDDSLDKSTRLRGNSVWAPPRSQIIFTIHPTPVLHAAMEAQRYLCAGCGMKVEKRYANTFRYCHYLGKFFCTGCHTLKRARLPQMILNRWDFSTYHVSNFSATLLESLQNDPVYNLMAINPGLSRKGRVAEFRNLRIQFRYVLEYLQNCKGGSELYAECLTLPKHYVSDVDLYCLEDLIQLRYGAGFPLKLKEIVSCSVSHILHCQLCKELGFLCELCKSFEVIFPFQTNRVSRCNDCKTCFHLRCFNPSVQRDCPKCLRLLARRLSVNNSNCSNKDFITELPV